MLHETRKSLIMVSLASPAGAMAPPPTPVKRPTLAFKRDSSYLDTDDEAGLSLSAKKLKVAFDRLDACISGHHLTYDSQQEELDVSRHDAPSVSQLALIPE